MTLLLLCTRKPKKKEPKIHGDVISGFGKIVVNLKNPESSH